jgi:hypothetical protein
MMCCNFWVGCSIQDVPQHFLQTSWLHLLAAGQAYQQHPWPALQQEDTATPVSQLACARLGLQLQAIRCPGLDLTEFLNTSAMTEATLFATATQTSHRHGPHSSQISWITCQACKISSCCLQSRCCVHWPAS